MADRKIPFSLDERGRVTIGAADLIGALSTDEAAYTIDHLCQVDKVMLNAVSMIVDGLWYDKDGDYWSVDESQINTYRARIIDQLEDTKNAYASRLAIELDRARAEAFFDGQRSVVCAIAGEDNEYRQRLWDRVLSSAKKIDKHTEAAE